jgi:hypothetical protein
MVPAVTELVIVLRLLLALPAKNDTYSIIDPEVAGVVKETEEPLLALYCIFLINFKPSL